MSQYYTITWVGERTREWTGQYGQNIDYSVALAEYDPTEHGGSRKTVTLTQKPETPAPQVGQKVYGGIVVQTITPKQGDPFEVYKLQKDRPPEGQPRPLSTNGVAQRAKSNGDGPGPEFWAQKDRRISRAGILQSVVASGKHNSLTGEAYVKAVNAATDALMASLDERAPSPNEAPDASEVEAAAQAAGVQVEAPEQTQVPVPEQPASFPADPDDDIPF